MHDSGLDDFYDLPYGYYNTYLIFEVEYGTIAVLLVGTKYIDSQGEILWTAKVRH